MTALPLFIALALLPPQTTPPPAPATSDQPAELAAPTQPRNYLKAGCKPPTVVYQVEPEFSPEARKKKVSGKALVGIIVDAQGNVSNVHIIRSVADSLDKKHNDQKHIAAAVTLDQRAVDAVKRYRFAPATCGGKAIAVELNVEVNFQIF